MKKQLIIGISTLLMVAVAGSTAFAAYGDPVFNNSIYATQAGAGMYHVVDQIINVWGDADGDGIPDVVGTQHNVNVDVIQGPDQDWSGTGEIHAGYVNYDNFLGAPNQLTSGFGGAAAGGSLIVGFDENFVNGNGDDFMVHGFGFSFNQAFSAERGTVNIFVADESYNPTISAADPVTGLISITGDETKWAQLSGWTGWVGGSWVGNPNHNYTSAPGAYGEYLWGDLEGSGLDVAKYIKFELGDGSHYVDPYTGVYNTTGRALFVDAVEARAVPVPGAVWLLGSGLVGLLGFNRKKRN